MLRRIIDPMYGNDTQVGVDQNGQRLERDFVFALIFSRYCAEKFAKVLIKVP